MSWKDLLPVGRRDAESTERATADRDTDDELLFHLRSLVDENLSRGMSHEEAWNDAQKRFGSLRSYWIQCRHATLSRGQLVVGLLAGGAVVMGLVVGWLTWEVRSLRNQQQAAWQDAKKQDQLLPPEHTAGQTDLVGQVFDNRGEPIGGADVFVILKTWPGGWFRQDSFAIQSEADGRFRLAKLIPRSGQFAVQAAALKDGYALTSSYQLKKADEDHALEPVVLRMNDASALTLVVHDGRGRPVPGARVVPSARRSAAGEKHLLYFQGSESARRASNAEGHVALRCLERGDSAEIYVRLPDGEWNLHTIEVPREGDRIEVSAAGTEDGPDEQTSNSRPRIPVRMVSIQSFPQGREAWAEKLAALGPDKAHHAFSVGRALAALPPDDGYAILAENWQRIPSVDARHDLLAAWVFVPGNPPRLRDHPRLLDVLHLGMHDGPRVHGSALAYLRRIALRDFSQDFAGYEAWYAANRDRPLAAVAAMAVRQFVADLGTLEDKPREQRMRLLQDAEHLFHDGLLGTRQAAIDAGLVAAVEGWATAALRPEAGRATLETAESGLRLLVQLELPEADLRRVMVPLTAEQSPSGMQTVAISALARPEFRWTVDVILDAMRRAVVQNTLAADSIVQEAADALGEIGDPRAIPPLIAVLTARGVRGGNCGRGLVKLSGAGSHPMHDADAWRAWWEQNKSRYPEVAQHEIPNYRRASAKLPPDVEFDILALNWPRLGPTYARQKILKTYFFRRHPRLLDALNLGMHDVVEVRDWAEDYVRTETLLDFSHDLAAYEAWWEATRTKTRDQIDRETGRRFAVQAEKIERQDAETRREFVRDALMMFHRAPAARQTALDAGALPIAERWLEEGLHRQAGPTAARMAHNVLHLIAALELPEADLRRVVVPLVSNETPVLIRAVAIQALGRREFPWAADLLRALLSEADLANRHDEDIIVRAAAAALAEIGDTAAIPLMIAAIEADNTYDTVYGVGYFGLGKLTGVKYDEKHDGAWWRAWWEKNKHRYELGSDTPSKTKIAVKAISFRAQDDVADVPAEDLRAGGDPKKRYFLIGNSEKNAAPADGYKLLFVLPGGDGGADFHPFVKRIYKHALSEEWLIAEPVAPQWDKKQFERITWPTAKSRYPAAKFTTEAFIAAILRDVRSKVPLDPRGIFMLGWSSGGPPVYATTVTRKSPVVGAFVAMSIFVPSQMPALAGGKDKAFYLLQSPDDRVTKFFFAERAEKTLQGAGAKVKIERYPGGHGWRGDLYGMLRDGIAWLEQNAAGGG